MKETYNYIKSYLLNGVFAYALFGVYALTVSPVIAHYINYGEPNIFVSVFGFVMLIAEFFALNFKLKMIRMRAQEKRLAYKKETGIDIIPSTGKAVFFAFFMRLVLRVTVVMVAMTALGYPCTEKLMSQQGEIVLMLWFILDLCGFIYMYFKSDFYTDPPQTRKDLQDELKEEDDWDKVNLPLASSESYFRKEIICDIILQIYTLMLFTSFWSFINDTGIEMLRESLSANESAMDATFPTFAMLFFVVLFGLMPMRIAYWIEDSMEAFTKRERYGMWITFAIVGIFVCAPTIMKWVSLFILRRPDVPGPEYMGYVISFILFFVILIVQILLFGKKDQTTK